MIDDPARPEPRASPLRGSAWPVFAYTLTLAAIGVVLGSLVTRGADGHQLPPLAVAAFSVMLAAAAYLEIRYQYGRQAASVDLFEAVLTPVVFVFPGLAAVVMAGAAQSLGELLRRVHPMKAAFNVAQWMFATAVGSIVFSSLRAGEAAPSPGDLPALIVAMVALSAVNYLALVGVLCLGERQPFGQVLAAASAGIFPEGAVVILVNLAFGILLVAAYAWAPLAIPLFLVPLGVLNWAGRAYASVRADRARLAGMQLATHALSTPMNPRDAIPEFLVEARRCFESEVAELVVLLEGTRMVYRSREHQPGSEQWIEEAGRETLAAALMRTGKAVRVSARDGEQELPRRLREEGWRDCLAAPVRVEGKVIGVLCTYNRTGFEGFEEGELVVLDALAAEVGTAIE